MVDIRPFQPSDLDAVRNLMAQLQSHEMQFSPEHVEPTREWLDRYISGMFKNVETAKGITLVATEDGKVCGFVSAYIEFELETRLDLFCISDLVVDQTRRGQGIGSTLLQNMEKIARDRGYKRMLIRVMADNVRAHKLYESFGFRNYIIDLLKKL